MAIATREELIECLKRSLQDTITDDTYRAADSAWEEYANAILEDLASLGITLCPYEPTEEMVDIGEAANWAGVTEAYKAMLSASPFKPKDTSGDIELYGPCRICGDTNYPMSTDGVDVCPNCACGMTPNKDTEDAD